MIFELHPTSYYGEKVRKLTKKNQTLLKRLEKTLYHLSTNPCYPSLKSHKANVVVINSKAYASWVNGEYRIVWDFEKENVISLLDFGTHNEVYL